MTSPYREAPVMVGDGVKRARWRVVHEKRLIVVERGVYGPDRTEWEWIYIVQKRGWLWGWNDDMLYRYHEGNAGSEKSAREKAIADAKKHAADSLIWSDE